MGTVVVQVSDRKWTTQAVHFACAMARNTQSRLVLLHLIPARSAYLLGTDLGNKLPTKPELDAIGDYQLIAEEYGLEITLQRMQYESFGDALVQAAELTHPSVLFANVPGNIFPFWRRIELWNLRHQLSAMNCRLYTLDEAEQEQDWLPAVSLTPSEVRTR